MLRSLLLTACLTGLFCAGFAMFVDVVTDMLQRSQVLVVSFISGFAGSIFAQTVLSRWRNRQK